MRYAARLMRPLVSPTIIAHSGAALYPLRLRVSGGRRGACGSGQTLGLRTARRWAMLSIATDARHAAPPLGAWRERMQEMGHCAPLQARAARGDGCLWQALIFLPQGGSAMIRSLLVITMVIAFAASQIALIACSNEDPQQTYEAAALANYRINQYGEYVLWGIDYGADYGADLTSDARARAESIGRNAANRAFDAAMEAIESEFEYAVAADAAILSFDEYLGNEYSNAYPDENDEITEEAYDELLFAIYVAVERADQVKSEAAERAGNAIVSAVNAAISAADIE